MNLVRGRGCDFGKVSKRSWEGQRFGEFGDFKKVPNLIKTRDFEKVSDLEKVTYLSLSATIDKR